MSANALAPYKRLTIKIGSALLVDKAGKLRAAWLADLAADIAALKAEKRDVVIVSSGAIALGRGLLGLSAVALTLEQSQAAASAGQIALSQAWAEALGQHGRAANQPAQAHFARSDHRHSLPNAGVISRPSPNDRHCHRWH